MTSNNLDKMEDDKMEELEEKLEELLSRKPTKKEIDKIKKLIKERQKDVNHWGHHDYFQVCKGLISFTVVVDILKEEIEGESL